MERSIVKGLVVDWTEREIMVYFSLSYVGRRLYESQINAACTVINILPLERVSCRGVHVDVMPASDEGRSPRLPSPLSSLGS